MELSAGDEVLTGAGIFGTVLDVESDRVTLETAPGTRITVLRSTIARRITDPATETPSWDEHDEDEAHGAYHEYEHDHADDEDDHDEHDEHDAQRTDARRHRRRRRPRRRSTDDGRAEHDDGTGPTTGDRDGTEADGPADADGHDDARAAVDEAEDKNKT